MSTHYIQVEGVNIYDSVFDTNQLSVVRGSSFLLKEAIDFIAETFPMLTPLSTGASSGLFQVQVQDEQSAQHLIKEISQQLSTHTDYRLFTFLAVHCMHHDFRAAKELLIAKLRFLQLQTLTLAPDPVIPDRPTAPCPLQGIRTAPPQPTQGERYGYSAVVRFAAGRDRRHQFYEKELVGYPTGALSLSVLDFTKDIEALAKHEAFTHLNNKIAVLYLDGNGFSGIQRAHVHNALQQQAFDELVKGYRKQFLGDLLQEITAGDALHFPCPFTDDQTLRFETLLWGGDEMLFVVPAWMGFDLLDAFYRLSADWVYEPLGASTDVEKLKAEKLTHAGGLVFCSAKTPIYRMRQLAKQLAEDVKESGEGKGREDNFFDYMVLESIDYPVEKSLSDFSKQCYQTMAERQPLSPFFHWREHKAELQQLLHGGISKGQVYRLASKAVQGAPLEELKKLEQRLELVTNNPDSSAQLEQMLGRLFPATGDDDRVRFWRWVHLTELWDYLAPKQRKEAC